MRVPLTSLTIGALTALATSSPAFAKPMTDWAAFFERIGVARASVAGSESELLGALESAKKRAGGT